MRVFILKFTPNIYDCDSDIIGVYRYSVEAERAMREYEMKNYNGTYSIDYWDVIE